jgi:hypothetical protein
MAIALFDSSILIDNLNGHAAAALEILSYDDAIISSITWMEVACVMDEPAKVQFQAFLDDLAFALCIRTTTSCAVQRRSEATVSLTRLNSGSQIVLSERLRKHPGGSLLPVIPATLGAKDR